ncbi:MAG: helicase-associated domain-containing protein, partial [Planctomycetota bacterium]
LFERLDLGLDRFEPDRWRAPLERARLGTLAALDFSRYGIGLAEPTLLVFPEVVVSILRRLAREDPPVVEREATCGADFASNLSRLLGSLVEGNVRFTAQGSVFRTTERRLAGGLIPMRTREATGGEVFELAMRFALARRLVDRTGERTFVLSSAGLAFGALPLPEKVRRILEGFLDERGLAGEFLHQGRLRRLFLRLLRRLPPGRWVEAMFLPFVARNAYLVRLDRLGVEEAFSSRAPAPTAVEDPQRLAWNLFAWVRRRLHLLGLVDLGYDASSRPVALRLTPFGSRLLRPGRLPAGGERLLVNPDFEVALFPGTGDPYDLVHALDRFCERTHSDPIFRFRITEASVRLGRAEGMSTEAMVLALKGESPVPQNVLFSIRAWAARAGVVRLESATLVRSEEPGVLDRFLEDPRVRERLIERISPTSALLRESPDARGMRARARDLGLRVEPA